MNNDGQGTGTTWTSDDKLTNFGLVLKSNTRADFNASARPLFFQIPVVDYGDWENECDDLCSNAAKEGVTVQLSEDRSIIEIEVIASVEGAELQVVLGGAGEWEPSSSTFNTDPSSDGLGISTSIIVGTDPRYYEIDLRDPIFNHSDDHTATTLWENWTDKNNIQSFGFRSGTPGATFTIQKISFGAPIFVCRAATNVIKKSNCRVRSENNATPSAIVIYPNPAKNNLTIDGTIEEDQIMIYDMLGVEVISTKTSLIDISKLALGTYTVNISREGALIETKQIQVQ